MRFLEQLPEAWQEQWQASGFNEPSTIQEKKFYAPSRRRKCFRNFADRELENTCLHAAFTLNC